MATIGKTYHVKLTQVSNAAVSYKFLLQENPDGGPAVQLGSTPYENDRVGVYDTIRIESLHRGTGQYLARDPMMYEWGEGMVADTPGVARTIGFQNAAGGPNLTNAAFSPWSRTTIIPLPSGTILHILPTGVYEGSTLKSSPAASALFTGSYAVFGGRVFFGECYDNGVSANIAFRDTDATYNNTGSFKASFLAAVAEKMWMVEQQAADTQAAFRWTDDTSTNAPAMSANYSGRLGRIRDLAIVGPHAILAAQLATKRASALLTLDSQGMFTPIVDDIGPVHFFTPFLGGQIAWLAGSRKALWLPDVGTYRSLDITGSGIRQAQAQIPYIQATSGATGRAFPGMAACSSEEQLFFSLYASQMRNRAGSIVAGSLVYEAALRDDGLHVTQLVGPEALSDLTDSWVGGMAIDGAPATVGGTAAPRKLRFSTAKLNGSNSDTMPCLADLGDVGRLPEIRAATRFLRTSRYVGNHWTTKMFSKLRGYARAGDMSGNPALGTLNLKLYLDGSETATDTQTVSIPSGQVTFDLPSNVIGRSIAIDCEWVTTSNGASDVGRQNLIVEFPWEIDYFTVPDQKDIIRLGIIAGDEQMDRAGGLTMRTRATWIQDIQAAIAAKTTFTLSWWDDLPNWTVIPLAIGPSSETEGQHKSGSGSAVLWLTCLRTA